jgi:hypothetical protein
MVTVAEAASFAGFASFALRTRTVIGAGPIPAGVKASCTKKLPGTRDAPTSQRCGVGIDVHPVTSVTFTSRDGS